MASYGALFNDVASLVGGNPDRDAPSAPSSVLAGRRYQNLLNAYIGGMPSEYGAEAQYQPLFTQLGLNNLQASRAAGVSGTAAVAPEIMQTERAYNPQATNLLDTLGAQATTQLGQNGGLDPAMQRALVQNVRSSQSARGLGEGPGDAAQENYYLTNTMDQRRQANQSFAANVGQMQSNYYKDPFSVAGAVTTPVSAGPTIMPSSQTDSMLGTVYNAQSATNIAAANNKAASDNAY